MTPLAQPFSTDEDARRVIREEIGRSLFVEASAGTGKTTELVRRIVRVLAAGAATIDRIVAVTFTHKAAGELKLRLRQGLDSARAATADPVERRNLESALERLEEAAIGTIHSFCAQILRQRPVEARVDPAFEEANEYQTARLFQRVFREWFEDALSRSLPGVRRALLRAARSAQDDSPIEELQRAAWSLVEWRDFPRPWARPGFAREQMTQTLCERVLELATWSAQCRNPADNLYIALQPARDFAAWRKRQVQLGAQDLDELELELIELRVALSGNKRKGYGFFADDLPRPRVLEARDRVIAALEGFERQAEADLAAELRDELWPLIQRYDQAKGEAGLLDFLDLLIRARDLVRDNGEVRSYLQNRFSHLFVDEFQDTDPIQAELLLLLSSSDSAETVWHNVAPMPGKLFVVGDPKQSIYKFRRADVVLYEQIRGNLAARGVELVRLTRSFRSARAIQQCVNAAFEPEMRGDVRIGQATYAPLEEHWPTPQDRPAVIALPVPRPYGTKYMNRKKIAASEPGAVVGFVRWLLQESGWKVRDPENPERLIPIGPSHVAVLFRRFINYGQDLTREYIRGFESLGIDHLLVGSKSYHRREEVESMRAALAAVEYPDDELSVFATLRGPLFSVSDSALLVYRDRHGPLHPFRDITTPVEGESAAIVDALAILKRLHRQRNYRPVAETVNQLLEATRAHATFALRPAGHQVLANLSRVCDLARNYEMQGGRSFRGFVQELEKSAEKTFAAEAPVMEDGAEGVRLMTVHTAKGLEFPVVILADITANQAQRTPERFVDPLSGLSASRLLRCRPAELQEHENLEHERELAEGVRVAYVASTRARDLLVIPAVGDGAHEGGWVNPLYRALYPDPQNHRIAQTAPGCPKFGDRTVLERPMDLMREGEFSVHPGLHRPQVGDHSVVWWDPKPLDLELEPGSGLRQEEILAEAGPSPSPGLLRLRQWELEREARIGKGSSPTWRPFTASQATAGPPGERVEVAIESARPAERPEAGARFGSLVHAVLALVPLDADGEQIRQAVEVEARVLGTADPEAEAALTAVQAALAHPVLGQARSADRVVREMPLLLHLQDRELLEGIVDLAFLTEGGWTIVDYKTDSDLEERREHYEMQIAWYCHALEKLEGRPARGILLRV